jgi:glycosyltransferase involved in cell wall biosynthesis
VNKKLRVSFIVPFTYMSGGIAVVLEYYRQLKALGHDVDIYYPLLPYGIYYRLAGRWRKFPERMRQFVRNIIKFKRDLTLFSESIPVKPVAAVNNLTIPDADAVIATAWPTAYDVAGLSPRKGKKFYFVQDYEIWHGCVDKVDNSYRLPLEIVTIAPWLTELMKSKFDRDDVTEIHNGVRLDKFYPPPAKDFGRPSILIMAHNGEWKGTQDAIDALTKVKERYPQLKITMFGMYARPAAPFDFEYHRNPSYEQLLSLYQNAAVFISPSRKEGWGLTPIEAMACKCAVIATNVGCIPHLNNGRNLILAEAKNPASIADAVVRLLENKELTEKTAEEGLKRVREQDWSKPASALSNLLLARQPAP